MAYIYKYPHPAVTTDCVILTFHEGQLKILLIRRGVEPYKGQWALPGGFMRMDESAEQCAYRELKEETGVTGCVIKQFHTFSAPGRDPRERVVTIAFYALMKWQKATGADDAEFADWIPVDNLPPLAFDHHTIIERAMNAIRRDIYFEPVGFELLNDTFSMPELQKVYEAILGREFDRRNFAKKMKHLNILDEVGPEKQSRPERIPHSAIHKSSSFPLPFLNDDFKPQPAPPHQTKTVKEDKGILLHYDAACDTYQDCQTIHSDKSDNDQDFMVTEKQKPKSRRKGLLFRLNKLNYKKLKNNDEIEF